MKLGKGVLMISFISGVGSCVTLGGGGGSVRLNMVLMN